MRKSDLQNGMAVEFRNGQRGMVVNDFIASLDDYLAFSEFFPQKKELAMFEKLVNQTLPIPTKEGIGNV